MDIKAHLKQLSELHGPSGYEAPIREALEATWKPLVDSLEVGRLGSLVGLKRGSGPEPRRKVMLLAHMDEIGMIVSGIEGEFVRFTDMGGTDDRILPGLPVIVHGKQPLRGVVGIKPIFATPENVRGRYLDFDEMFIDLGLPAERVAELVTVGDVITPDARLLDLQGSRVAGKAMDDRACVAAVTACLDYLQGRRHTWDVLAVASVQEEVGLHGARVEAYRLAPDIAIALDVTFAPQPGVDGATYRLGGNPVLALGANFHPALFDAIDEAANRIEMSLPHEPIPMGSGTDAWVAQTRRDGIPVGLISIPSRNMHSTVETVDTKDIERAGRVLAEFIAGLDADFLASIVWEKDQEQADKKEEKETAKS